MSYPLIVNENLIKTCIDINFYEVLYCIYAYEKNKLEEEDFHSQCEWMKNVKYKR